MNVHILSTAGGCQTNLFDNARLRARLAGGGFRLVAEAESADWVIINTCGFNAAQESQSLAAVKRHSLRSDKKTVVFGCLPKINREALGAVFDGPVFGAGEIDRLCEFMGLEGAAAGAGGLQKEAHFLDELDQPANSLLDRLLKLGISIFYKAERAAGRRSILLHNIPLSTIYVRSFFNIQVSSGCLGECSYCAIKSAKGSLRSTPIEEIMERFRFALDSGHRAFRLLGDDLGCWGQDIGLDSAILLERLLSVRERFEIVVDYFHPAWLLRLSARLKPLFADPRVIGVNFPIQSGSDKVLGLMNRRYDARAVTDALAAIKELNPGLVLKTHLMVGFPFEDESDFRRSLALVQNCDIIRPFIYAPRPGTKIVELGDKGKVPDGIKNSRLRRMRLKILSRYLAIGLKGISQFKKPAPAVN